MVAGAWSGGGTLLSFEESGVVPLSCCGGCGSALSASRDRCAVVCWLVVGVDVVNWIVDASICGSSSPGVVTF